MDDLIKLVGWVTIGICSYIYGGLVLVNLWTWFIIPALHVPVITIPEGMGFMLIASFLTTRDSDSKLSDKIDSDSKASQQGKLVLIKLSSNNNGLGIWLAYTQICIIK